MNGLDAWTPGRRMRRVNATSTSLGGQREVRKPIGYREPVGPVDAWVL